MSKLKRNDPCPCGSGKKYKKCCGQKKALPQRSFANITAGNVQSNIDKLRGRITSMPVQNKEKEEKLDRKVTEGAVQASSSGSSETEKGEEKGEPVTKDIDIPLHSEGEKEDR